KNTKARSHGDPPSCAAQSSHADRIAEADSGCADNAPATFENALIPSTLGRTPQKQAQNQPARPRIASPVQGPPLIYFFRIAPVRLSDWVVLGPFGFCPRAELGFTVLGLIFGQDSRNGMRIYVGNLPFSCTEDELRTHFGSFGAVTSAAIVIDRETGRP